MKFVFLMSLVLGCCLAQDTPEPGKVYAIQNARLGFLRTVGNGTICKHLSHLTVSYIEPIYPPEEYQWTITKHDLFGTTIHHKLINGFGINEMTYDEYPPYCYLVYREVELLPIFSGLSFAIKSVRTNKCLSSTNWEEEHRATWEECSGPGQNWYFKEIPLNKLP